MKLTLKTDYALRTLIYLGQQHERLASIAEVAQFYGISQNHLVKIVHELGRKGVIETIRGKGGGIQLAPHARQLRLSDIVRAMEEDLAPVPCLQAQASQETCRLANHCRLQSILHQAMHCFMAELDKYTLADLIQPAGNVSVTQPLLPYPIRPASGSTG